MRTLLNTTLLAIALISSSAFANDQIKKLILNDETIISGSDIALVNIIK